MALDAVLRDEVARLLATGWQPFTFFQELQVNG